MARGVNEVKGGLTLSLQNADFVTGEANFDTLVLFLWWPVGGVGGGVGMMGIQATRKY